MYFRSDLGLSPKTFGFLIPFMLLDLVLRGISLWRSAQKKQQWWFIALLVVNSLGILPAVYLLINQDSKTSAKKKK